MTIDRRTLIRRSCLAAAAMTAGPKWLAAGFFDQRMSAASDTILVIVQMAGGNDALNTLVPHSDPAYRAARQRIRLEPSQTLRVDAGTGLHPSLTNLHRYLGEGKLGIVQGVGYPNPDLSHFNSMEYWHRASFEVKRTGWLGDTLDQLYGREASPLLHAISVGGDMPPAFESNDVSTTVLQDAESFDFPGDALYPDDSGIERAAFQAMLAPIGRPAADFVAHVGDVMMHDSAAIRGAASSFTPLVRFPDSDLGRSLQLTAAVVAAGVGPRLFWVTQGSYDTHDSQRGPNGQDGLLSDLDQSVSAFYEELKVRRQDQRVLVMTWSEFGRRVEENGSSGTDHGAASLLFVLGSRVRGGLHGTPLSLTDLDPDGNLKFSVDFRRVYASILANWIGADPVPILNGVYPTIDFV